MEKTRTGATEIVAVAGAALLAGCQCTPPAGGYVETRTEVDVPNACTPAKVVSCAPGAASSTTVTVTHRTGDACAALPPVGEITVVRSCPTRTNMVFVSVRPSDDRCFNVESRNFERPWPWGAYGMGSCEY